MYYSNLTIGSPPQEIQVELDTSSGYLEITATNSTWCKDSNCTSGFFDINASSTYQFANEDFNTTYTWDNILTGDFGSDDVAIDGVTLSSMDLAVNFGLLSDNILGLGYIAGKTSDAPATILQALIDGGHIKSAAYSLWVDGSTEGTILFGGVNTAKYTGELHTMSIPASNGIHYLPVALVTGISLQMDSASNSQMSVLPTYMALDSKVSQTFLPDDIVERIYQDLGVWWDGQFQVGRINCTMKQKDYNITFTFIDFSISSPLSDFIGTGNGETCQFNIVPSFGETSVLGDTFLRNVYVVYDLSNNEISMAPTNFDESEGQILEIGSGATPISGAVPESATATAAIPTAVVSPTAVRVFPATSTSGTSTATSTSKGAAAAPTAIPNIMAGFIGAGLLIAL